MVLELDQQTVASQIDVVVQIDQRLGVVLLRQSTEKFFEEVQLGQIVEAKGQLLQGGEIDETECSSGDRLKISIGIEINRTNRLKIRSEVIIERLKVIRREIEWFQRWTEQIGQDFDRVESQVQDLQMIQRTKKIIIDHIDIVVFQTKLV